MQWRCWEDLRHTRAWWCWNRFLSRTIWLCTTFDNCRLATCSVCFTTCSDRFYFGTLATLLTAIPKTRFFDILPTLNTDFTLVSMSFSPAGLSWLSTTYVLLAHLWNNCTMCSYLHRADMLANSALMKTPTVPKLPISPPATYIY